MNYFKIIIFFVCSLMLSQLSTQGQVEKVVTNTFSGQVTDKNKVPLAGASIEIQEKNNVQITGKDGKFSITTDVKDIAIIKRSGYLTKQLVLDALSDMNVVLELALTDAGEEDNVEIPFGVRKKRELTSAVSSYQTANLPQIPLSNLINSLAGRISGLHIQQADNRPGNDNAFIFVRGRSSYGSAGARILVDGVQRDFQDMDLNEIESITVLKDAAALAFYGLRAGHGVILVTTKRGSAVRSSINFDIQGGIQQVDHIIKPLNSFQFASLYNEARLNDRNTITYDSAALNAYQNGSNPFKYPNNNFSDQFLKKTSAIQRYVLSAEGGNNALRYFILLSYFDQGGLLKGAKSDDFNSNTGFKRFNFRGNIDFDVNPNLLISLYAGGRSENRLNPGDGVNGAPNGFLNTLFNTPPNAFPILNENGTYGGTTEFRNNPLGMIRDRGYTTAIDRVLLTSVMAKQKLDFWLPGLSAHMNFSYDASGTYSAGLNRDYEIYDFNVATPQLFRTKTPLGYRSAAFTNNNRRNEIWAGLDYDRIFGNHGIKASVRGQRYVNNSPERLDFRGQGVSGRVDYGFRQKYYLGLVAGFTGSENFPPDRRYGLFPAVSAGWVVTEEKFLRGGNLLSYLKLRGSAGSAGNSEIGGSRFPFESFYARNTGGGGYVFGTGFSGTPSANESNLGNPLITWETIKTVDAGLEMKLLKNSLYITADFYKARRSGILTEAVIPSILGQNLGTVNEGVVDSKGMEFDLGYSKQVGDFNVSFNGNLLVSKDKVITQNGQQGLPDYQKSTGKIAGSSLIFLSDGLFKDQAQIDASPTQSFFGRIVPGDVKYKDIGSISGKPDNLIDNFDRVRVNKRDFPNVYYGFGNTFTYKVIDFSTQWQGIKGRTVDIQGLVNSGPFQFNQESLGRWTPQTAATAKYPRVGLVDRGNNTAGSDFWRRSGDFLRLKYVELGVSLPPTFLKKYNIKKTRFYVGGFNLLTFTKLDLDVDPEIPGAGRGDQYPYLKTFSFGLRTTF
ncbi:MAG: SusC/RagA family TonB-linked outer membrane protein [Chitinophagaceae bacterium]